MKKRITFTALCHTLLFSLLLGRLFVMTLYPDQKSTVTTTGLRVQSVFSNRGTIFDRQGEALVNTTKEYLYLYFTGDAKNSSASQNTLPFTAQELTNSNNQKGYLSKKSSILFPSLQENMAVFPTYKRYTENQPAAQLIGYTDGDGRGVMGLEKLFDDLLLHGGNALTLSFLTNAKGGLRVGTGVEPAFSEGTASITLTLDKKIQEEAERLMHEANLVGAVVISDCRTGELLAIASAPTFDPDNITEALEDTNSPFLQRAFLAYDAGSIFKIVTAAAALEEGLDIEHEGYCGGYYPLQSGSIACSNRYGHGWETMTDAFSESCNPYFCRLAVKVGGQKLLSVAKNCGFGAYTELFPGLITATGSLPSLSQLQNEDALALFGFGQGNLSVTPLQMTTLVNIVANSGIKTPLSLVTKQTDRTGKTTCFPKTESVQVLSQDTTDKLKAMMTEVVENGSGKLAFSAYFSSGGKTGTAETGWYFDGESMVHGWFVGFFPADAPQYSIVVFCENGKSGAQVAAPIFRQLSEFIFLSDNPAES